MTNTLTARCGRRRCTARETWIVPRHVKAGNAMVTKLGTYDRDWQALRAIVEQHTVKP